MHLVIPKEFYFSTLSVLILVLGSLVALMQRDKVSKNYVTLVELTQVFFLSASLCACFFNQYYGEFLGGAFFFSRLTKVVHILILSVSLFISLLFLSHPERKSFFRPEISFLYQLITAGMLVFTASYDLVTLLISLEISSLGVYTLIGYLNPGRKSLEGAMKYFLLGSLATAFLLLGISFVYASAASLNIKEIMVFVRTFSQPIWFHGGLLLMVLGFAFKLALVPFHFWAPDAYESAPTGITAFMATGFKIIIIAVLLRLFPLFQLLSSSSWAPLFSILVGLSIIVGNILALSQFSVKRTLAYSSIAHSGYMAIALCALSTGGTLPSLLFYLVSYVLASLLAFGALMSMETKENQNLSLDDLKGYGRKNPMVAFLLSFSLFSLAGLPPTVGFLGKLFIFSSALKGNLFPLVLIAVLGSAISLYYYLRIIVHMYMKEEDFSCLYPAAVSKKKSYLLILPFLVALLLGTIWPQKFFDTLSPKSTYSVKK